MVLFHVNFFSDVLGLSVAMAVILSQPAPGTRRSEQKLPVLWLLHGLSDAHTIWQRRTSIERYGDTMIQRVLAWLPLPEARTA